MKVLVADPFEQSGLDGLAAAGCEVVFDAALNDAALAAARLQVVGLRSAYDQQKLLLASALQTQAFTSREAARQQALQAAGVASRQQAAEARPEPSPTFAPSLIMSSTRCTTA